MKVHLIHWRPEEAVERIDALKKLGHEVVYVEPDNSGNLKHVRASRPDVLLIDVTRSLSHGRAVGVEARRAKGLREIPLLFVGGEEEKVKSIRELLPDATYCDWKSIRGGLAKAKKRTKEALVVPKSYMETFAHKPLAAKLGIKEGMTIGLFQPPDGFDRAIAGFPADIEWKEEAARGCAMALIFAGSLAALEATFPSLAAANIPIWVFWPKRASGVITDITQSEARTVGHAFGFTDCKVCSFDATWSGFLFRMKRK
jgi:hypothetical protein